MLNSIFLWCEESCGSRRMLYENDNSLRDISSHNKKAEFNNRLKFVVSKQNSLNSLNSLMLHGREILFNASKGFWWLVGYWPVWGYDGEWLSTAFACSYFEERLSEKVQTAIPKGIVGGFEFTVLQRSLKEWLERPLTYVCGC